jgi:DNA-binding IclR family transcriptional regulator
LEKAIRRAEEALVEEQDFASRLAPLLESLAGQGRYLTRLAVRDRDHLRVLDADEVDWIGV